MYLSVELIACYACSIPWEHLIATAIREPVVPGGSFIIEVFWAWLVILERIWMAQDSPDAHNLFLLIHNAGPNLRARVL